MKKITFPMSWVTGCLLVILTITGCKKDSENEITLANRGCGSLSPEDQELVEIYSGVGDFHNEGLDYVYDKLKEKADRTAERPMEVGIEEIYNWSGEYVKGKLSPEGEALNFTNFYPNTRSYIPFDADVPFPDRYMITEAKKLSPELSAALNDYQAMFLNDDLNLDRKNYDDMLQNWIPRLETQSDKIGFIMAVNVGQKSLLYWRDNHDKWADLVISMSGQTPTTTTSNLGGPGKEIVTKDIETGLQAGMTGAYIGATGGSCVVPGVGTVTGAAGVGIAFGVGGAAAGSATAAIMHYGPRVVKWVKSFF